MLCEIARACLCRAESQEPGAQETFPVGGRPPLGALKNPRSPASRRRAGLSAARRPLSGTPASRRPAGISAARRPPRVGPPGCSRCVWSGLTGRSGWGVGGMRARVTGVALSTSRNELAPCLVGGTGGEGGWSSLLPCAYGNAHNLRYLLFHVALVLPPLCRACTSQSALCAVLCGMLLSHLQLPSPVVGSNEGGVAVAVF